MRMRNLILAFGLIFLVTVGAVAAQNSGGFLGVRLQDGDDGVVIRQVVEGSPAAAVLQEDDIITAVNGAAVSTAAEVAAVVQAATPGERLALTITRGGEALEVEVELGSAPPASTVEPGQGNNRRGGGDNQPPFQLLETAIIYNPAEEVWEVRQLTEDTPLYAAGLRQGDVVSAFDGEALDMMGLRALVEASSAESMITLTVERDGAEQEIAVPAPALAEFYLPMRLEGNLPVERGYLMPNLIAALNGRLGVTFVTLTDSTAAENDVEFVEGALITELDPDSPAAQASLAVGDIVTAVNGEPVDQERTLRDRLFAYEPGDVVTLTVLRDGESLDLEVTLGEQLTQTFMLPPGMSMPGFRFDVVPPTEEVTPEPGMMPDVQVTPGA